MDREKVVGTIEEIVGPSIGRHMARSSVELHCRKAGVSSETVSQDQLRAVLEGLGKGMVVFVGREKTESLVRQIESALGLDGVRAS